MQVREAAGGSFRCVAIARGSWWLKIFVDTMSTDLMLIRSPFTISKGKRYISPISSMMMRSDQ